MNYTYIPQGVCSRQMNFDIENGVIKQLEVIGGCSGNLQGISKLVQNQNIDDVIEKLEGIKCGMKNTSCPDQIAKALKKYKEENK